MGVPQELVLMLKQKYNVKTFIETGTYLGGTALWAAQYFQSVTSIERSKKLYDNVSEKYRHLKNIDFVNGDTRDSLRTIVPQLKEPCIFLAGCSLERWYYLWRKR